MAIPSQDARRELWLLACILLSYVLVAMIYILIAPEYGAEAGPGTSLSRAQIALGSGGIILIVYGSLALVGRWLAHRIDLPAIAAPGVSLRQLAKGPMLVGAVLGIGMVLFELGMRRWFAAPVIPHPAFPASLPASYSAAVGEEIIFRLFLLNLWAVLLNPALRRIWGPASGRAYALAFANSIAALGFAAAHLGSAMVLFGVTSPAQLALVTLVELTVLNGAFGLVAGRSFMRYGLVGASLVHLGADIVWHVVYGLLN